MIISFKIKYLTIITCAIFIVILLNLLTIGSPLNVVVTIPQYVVVLYFLITKQVDKALLWHLTFIVTSISSFTAAELSDAGQSLAIYNYARLKLVGPVGLSYLISILIFLVSIRKTISLYKGRLFYKLYRISLYLGVQGCLFGCFGLIFLSHYSFDKFVSSNIYIWMIVINMLCIMKNHSGRLLLLFNQHAFAIIIGAIFATFIAYLLGVTTSYGGQEGIILSADVMYFAPMLLVGIFMIRHKTISVISLLLFFVMTLQSAGGKTVFIVIIAILFFLYYLFFSKAYRTLFPVVVKYGRYVVIPLLLVIIIAGGIKVGGFASYKVQSAFSLFSGDIDSIDRSPYIRVASLLNIINNGKDNLVRLCCGNGYGGYFTDDLHLFVGVDLKGGWTDDVVATGYFTTAHDTFAMVPLVNGFIGLFLLLYICVLYIKRIKFNYLAFAAIPWLAFTFYFSVQLALSGLFFLYAAEYNRLNKNESYSD